MTNKEAAVALEVDLEELSRIGTGIGVTGEWTADDINSARNFLDEEEEEIFQEPASVDVMTIVVTDSPWLSDVLASVVGLRPPQLRDLIKEKRIRHGTLEGYVYARVDDVVDALGLGRCQACEIETEIGTKENPHPVPKRFHTCGPAGLFEADS